MGLIWHFLFWCFDAVILTVPAAILWEAYIRWRHPIIIIGVDWATLNAPTSRQIIDEWQAAIAAAFAVPSHLLTGNQEPEPDAAYRQRILDAIGIGHPNQRNMSAELATGRMLDEIGRIYGVVRHGRSQLAFIMEPPSVAAARNKSIALLREWLTPAQREQYDRDGAFDVIGGDIGKRYRIGPPGPYNISELDATDHVVANWCVVPTGASAPGDVMLAQKIALEKQEFETLRIANKQSTARQSVGRP